MKRLTALCLAAALCLSLAGCGGMTTFDATAYVKGLLDETYKGSWDAVYLDLVDLTDAEAQKAYDDGIDQEYQRFAYQFDLQDSYLEKETRTEVKDLLRDICKRAGYAVKTAVPLDDTRYAVEVSIRPMDLFLQVRLDSLQKLQTDFEKKYADANPDVMNAAQKKSFWTRYENDWAKQVVKLCRETLGTMAFLDVQPILVLVAPDEKGFYKMQDNDFVNLSALILPY